MREHLLITAAAGGGYDSLQGLGKCQVVLGASVTLCSDAPLNQLPGETNYAVIDPTKAILCQLTWDQKHSQQGYLCQCTDVVRLLSCVQCFAASPVGHQASLSFVQARRLEFGLPISPPGDLPDPGIQPSSSASAGRLLTTELPEKTFMMLFLLFSRSVVSDSLQPYGPQHARLPCPSPTPGACSNSRPSSW